MNFSKNIALVSALLFTSLSSAARGEEQTFVGDISATANPETFALAKVEIRGEAALALFNTTVAGTRVENLDDHTRVVRGGNLSCYEHFATTPLELPVYYSCEFFVEQAGYIRR